MSAYVDLRNTQFTTDAEGACCYSIDTTVKGRPLQRRNCINISTDPYVNRVFCIEEASSYVLDQYLQALGPSFAQQVTPEELPRIYSDTIRQFLPTLRAWGLCDPDRFLQVRQQVLDQHQIPKEMVQAMDFEYALLKQALAENNCQSGSSAVLPRWALVTVVVVAVVVGVALFAGVLRWVQKRRVSARVAGGAGGAKGSVSRVPSVRR